MDVCKDVNVPKVRDVRDVRYIRDVIRDVILTLRDVKRDVNILNVRDVIPNLSLLNLTGLGKWSYAVHT